MKPLLERYRHIVDIVLFGSFVKGKISPEDADAAVLVRTGFEPDALSRETDEIFDSFNTKELSKVHLQIVNVENVTREPVFLTLIKEGYSVRDEKFLSDIYEISPVILYKYDLKSLTGVQKVQFERGMKRILEECGGKKLVRTVVLVPSAFSSRFEDFLKTWKMEFQTGRFELIGERIASGI